MEKSRAIELLKLAVPIKALTQQEYADFVEAVNMGMDALKAQHFSEGTTKDTISRQAALEKVRAMQTYKLFIGDDMILVDKAEVQTELMMLPPAQPEKRTEKRTETHACDLISRQQAIDALDCINGTEEVLRSLPPAQPEPQWIPVSERLPEDLTEVNVTWVNRNPESYYESIKDKPFTTTAVYYKGEWYWLSATCVDYLAEYGRCDWNKVDKAIEIIAWMPLPEPYKPNK